MFRKWHLKWFCQKIWSASVGCAQLVEDVRGRMLLPPRRWGQRQKSPYFFTFHKWTIRWLRHVQEVGDLQRQSLPDGCDDADASISSFKRLSRRRRTARRWRSLSIVISKTKTHNKSPIVAGQQTKEQKQQYQEPEQQKRDLRIFPRGAQVSKKARDWAGRERCW